MSLVKWVRNRDLHDGPFTFAGPDYDGVAVIPLAALTEVVEGLQRAERLIELLTVRQVIEGGCAEEAGLNPYCMNEGLATGEECIDARFIRCLLTKLEAHGKEGA